MLIAGAGGHAREVLDVLLMNTSQSVSLAFYDDTHKSPDSLDDQYQVFHSKEEIQRFYGEKGFEFCLGVGNPFIRYSLFKKLKDYGGDLKSIVSATSLFGNRILINNVDVMSFAFIGPDVQVGLGTLINTRANVHHDVIIGEFTEISPMAALLGASMVGSFSQIGAGAILLPKVRIGSNVVVGAGSIITRDVPDNSLVVGAPGKVIRELEPLQF